MLDKILLNPRTFYCLLNPDKEKMLTDQATNKSLEIYIRSSFIFGRWVRVGS